MKKSKVRIFIVLLSITIGLSYFIYDGFKYAPSRIRINYKYIQNEKIHSDLDGMQIAFISDLHYLNFFDDERLDYLIERLNSVNPDVLVFTGDLVDKEMDVDQYNKLFSALDSIKAKFGKFAVLGEADYKSEEINNQVEKILYDADFEVLHNTTVKITKNSQQAFYLTGIDSPIDLHDDIDKAYENFEESLFRITAIHTPDKAIDLPQHQTDLVLAGHSHGGQVNIPLLGQVYNQELANVYYSGIYNVGTMKLYVNNGIGTTHQDVRINAPAEIVVYTLKSK